MLDGKKSHLAFLAYVVFTWCSHAALSRAWKTMFLVMLKKQARDIFFDIKTNTVFLSDS